MEAIGVLNQVQPGGVRVVVEPTRSSKAGRQDATGTYRGVEKADLFRPPRDVGDGILLPTQAGHPSGDGIPQSPLPLIPRLAAHRRANLWKSRSSQEFMTTAQKPTTFEGILDKAPFHLAPFVLRLINDSNSIAYPSRFRLAVENRKYFGGSSRLMKN